MRTRSVTYPMRPSSVPRLGDPSLRFGTVSVSIPTQPESIRYSATARTSNSFLQVSHNGKSGGTCSFQGISQLLWWNYDLTIPEQRVNGIPAALREPQGPGDTPDKLEEELQTAEDVARGIWMVGHISSEKLSYVDLFSTHLNCTRPKLRTRHRRRLRSTTRLSRRDG